MTLRESFDRLGHNQPHGGSVWQTAHQFTGREAVLEQVRCGIKLEPDGLIP